MRSANSVELAVERQVEMRDGALGLDQAARNRLAHVVVRDELVGAFGKQFQHLIVRHRLCRCSRSCRRRADGCGFRGRRSLGAAAGNRRLDIGLDDAAMRARAGHGGYIDAGILGDTARQWRGKDTLA